MNIITRNDVSKLIRGASEKDRPPFSGALLHYNRISPHILTAVASISTARIHWRILVFMCCPAFEYQDPPVASRGAGSEEHTSELQSRFELVSRLLLELRQL